MDGAAPASRLPGSGRPSFPGRINKFCIVNSFGTEHNSLVPNEMDEKDHQLLGSYAKRYYFAGRSMLEMVLRPYDLGATQYALLYHLAHGGPALQRDLAELLHIERSSLSGIVATLVGKGLVEQVTGPKDQRQRLLRLTEAGAQLWQRLPDPLAIIHDVALEGVDQADILTAIAVLEAATQRLNQHLAHENP